MNHQKAYRFIILMTALVIGSSVFAQNTKGDKPTSPQTARGKKIKTKSRSKSTITLKKIFSRRVNVHSESRAARIAYNKPMPYARKNVPDRSRSGKPIGGRQVRVRSSSAEVARNNIYPKNYRWNFNPTPNAPKDNYRGFSNREQLAKINSMVTRREPPQGRRIVPKSNSSPFRTRRKTNANVYWGKIRRGVEKSVTTDIAGRPLRTRDFHSANPGLVLEKRIIPKKTQRGDRPYRGSFINHFVVASPTRTQRAWKGDISGHPLRKIQPRPTESSGVDVSAYPRRLSNSGKARNFTSPVPTRYPGQGISVFQKFLNKVTGLRTMKGGGSNSKRYNNNGRPIQVRTPGIGANMGNFSGKIKSQGKLFSQSGLSYSGDLRAGRPLKGGGSNSKSFNNNGHAIQVRTPGIGANMGNFSGNIRGGQKSFNQTGYSFSGNIKGRRPLKGGGSNSGQLFNNNGHAIQVRTPGIGANMGNFSGNMRGGIKSFNRDGYSYTGNMRGGEKTFSQSGYGFAGNIKARRPLKGGGSNSGQLFNNNGHAIQVRTPGIGANMGNFSGNMKGGIKSFSRDGYSYTGNMRGGEKMFSQSGYGFAGNIKARRPLKGGGSNSRSWNNDGKPIIVRGIASGARLQGSYQGSYKLRELSPGFGYQGELYKGSMKAHGPKKGGGSISGKLWNNDGKPILTKAPGLAEAKEIGYSGKIKLPFFKKKYVRNPNAVKEGLKTVRPSKYVETVGELQVKVKQPKSGKNPLSAKAAINGLAPSKNSVRAIEYVGKMKMTWAYVRNPSGYREALKSIKPTTSFMKGNDFAGRQKMKRYVHNPASNKYALKVLAPARVVARIRDYQGNVKMNKAHGSGLHPDSEFAHGFRNNVKKDRTILINIKLMWSKLFRKNATQPAVVKEKVRRPRYDKKERELWKDLYD
ncbi:MAG: Phosphoglyceromutase [Cytophagales bacterium]|nr:MAG: Phosphoglyceromutase [Cytophagales bacterium]